MALNIRKFLQGLGIVPKASSTVDQQGEMDVTSGDGKLNYHNGSSASPMVTEAHSATLTNKTLTDNSTVIADATDATKQIKFDAAGSTGTATTLTSSQTTNQTLTLPDATDTLVGKNTTDTLTNKTIDTAGPNTLKVNGNTLSASAGTATITIPNSTDTLVGRATSDTLTNKTLSVDDNTVSGIAASSFVLSNASGNIDGAAAQKAIPTGTVVGTSDSQTLTNKTLTSAVLNTPTADTITGIAGGDLTVQSASNQNLVLDAQGTGQLRLEDAVILKEQATPGVGPTVPSGYGSVYAGNDGNAYYKNAAGTVTQLGAGGGASTTVTATAGENLTANDAVYIASASDSGRTVGQAYKLDPTNDKRVEFLGLVTATVTSGNTATIQVAGSKSGFTGLSAGTPLFASTTTPGSYQTTAPGQAGQWIIQLGEAISATSVAVNAAGSATAVKVTANTIGDPAATLSKNYITNNNFETNSTLGFSLFNTTLNASKIPTGSITAGAASLTTFGTTTSSALNGQYSLELGNSTGAISAGQGLISDPFTIDRADQAKMLQFRFNYAANLNPSNMNFSGTSSNTWAVYIYDVSGAAWIQPAGVYNIVQNSGVGIASGTFQTTATGTQYRIALICINASAGAASMLLDEMGVGPQSRTYGPAMSDWVSYTPALTASGSNPSLGSGGNFNQQGRWRRVGDTMQVQTSITWGTSGTGFGSGTYRIGLPTGFSIDTSKVATPGPSGVYALQGVGAYWDASPGTGASDIVPVYDGAGTTYVSLARLGGGSNVNPTTPITWANGDTINLEFFVPITGWSSNTLVSTDTDTRVVAARYTRSTNQTFANGANTEFVSTTQVFDTHGAYNSSTGRFTAPVPGRYRVSCRIQLDNNVTWTSAAKNMMLYKNGSLYSNLGRSVTSGASVFIDFPAASDTIDLVAGDYISIFIGNNEAFSARNSADANFNYVSIERISGPSQIAASEVIGCAYNINATQSVTGTAAAITTYGTKRFDTHGAFNSSTGVFTCPAPGLYSVSAAWSYASTLAQGNGIDIRVAINGSDVEIATLAGIGGTADTYQPRVSTIVQCNAGDTITLKARCAVSVTSANSSAVGMSIHRIGGIL